MEQGNEVQLALRLRFSFLALVLWCAPLIVSARSRRSSGARGGLLVLLLLFFSFGGSQSPRS